MKRIKAERSHCTRWEHFGCIECGDVFKLPFDRDEKSLPWCVHANNYSWNPPQSEESDWVQMVKVDVFVR